MADTYLPADVRKRIIDVMRERKLTPVSYTHLDVYKRQI